MKVIVTGATGMLGEGVLLECLQNPVVTEVLMINRKPAPVQHAKLTELLVPDFTQLEQFARQVRGYHACFYCAGISSVGMKEEKYYHITYTTTMAFAKVLLAENKDMVFCFVSGSHTDSTEKGKLMWARVKGKTENALMALPFKNEYNFRPGGMLTSAGQKNGKALYYGIVKTIQFFSPKSILTMQQVGRAMINSVKHGYPRNILEISDIRTLAESN